MKIPMIVLGTTTMLLACSPHKVTHNPAPPMELPDSYSAAAPAQDAPLPETWWKDFNQPQLDALIAETLTGNFQLRAAWARVRQARTFVKQANSGKYPQLEVSGSAARQKSRFNLQDQVIVNQNNMFSASIGAGYELDLWRRMASNGDGAALDALAMRDDVESIAITLAAEVTEAWFDLVFTNAQLKLLGDQLETNEVYLELIELRFQKGLASSLDIFQQRQQLVSTRAQVTQLQGSKRLLGNRLAILLGKPPQGLSLGPGDTLPDLPSVVPGTGLPADLLDRRPDVRAARRRVEAADHRVAVAVADRLPSLRVSGSVGLNSPSLAKFLTSPVWTLLSSITAPLFDGGRRKAEVERTRAVVEERLMQYGQALLQAMVEVENSVANEARQLAYIEDLKQLLELSTATLEQARLRYQQGLVDYLPVLSALQGRQRAELTLLQARRSLLSYRIQLCRALGGTWTQELKEVQQAPARESVQEPAEESAQEGASS